VIIDNYLETLKQPNVTLVDIKNSPIDTITPQGVKVGEHEYELDMLILATGFDSATGSLLTIDIRGRNGLSLRDKWVHGHRTYLGIGVHGFPNMFIVAQAGSPGIRSHVMVSIEQHVEWIAGLIAYAKKHGVVAIEPTQDAEQAWTGHVAEVAGKTLLTVDDTQYLGSNVPGKPRVVTSYVGGVGTYRRICEAVAANGYEGFALLTPTGPIENSCTWSGPIANLRDAPKNTVAGFL
jgi:cyclohexanone monooxygenase